MFQRLSGSFLNRCLGVQFEDVMDAEGSMPSDYGYIQLKGYVEEVASEQVLILPTLLIRPSQSTMVVINPSLEILRHTTIVEPHESIYAIGYPDIDLDNVDWVFRIYSIKRQ